MGNDMTDGNQSTYESGKAIVFDGQSIRKLSRDITTETSVLLNMLDIANAKVEETKTIFDSVAGTSFRTKMASFIADAKEGSKTSLTNLANSFEEAAKLYDKTDAEIAAVADQILSEKIFE